MGGVRVEVRVLGPLEVLIDGRRANIAGGKAREVMALLALNLGQLTPVDRILEEVWREEAPADGKQAVQFYISRLRAALLDAADAITTRPAGYVLDSAAASCDALTFEREVTAAGEILRGRDAAMAATSLRNALERWRGPALAGLCAPATELAAARLEELRLGALEDAIEAELQMGATPRLIAETEALTSQYPLRERLWAHRMVALYKAGRQADALRCFSTVRAMLLDELGVDPSPALRDLEGRILRQDPSLLAGPGGAVRLLVDGPGGQWMVKVGPDGVTVGRAADNDVVVLGDPEVSGRHARLRPAGGHCVVEDLGSTNGTYVNDVRIAVPTTLGPADSIRIGATRLTIAPDVTTAPRPTVSQ